jgi:hypothetical protein
VSHSVICYAQPGKARSREVLSAFAAGCRGAVVENPPARLIPGPAAFYGCVGLEHLLLEARCGREWYYGDNAYFDRARGTHFRFAQNALQFSGCAMPEPERFARLGIEIKPWKKDGRHIVVVEQSAHFLRLAGEGHDWYERTVSELKRHTDRPIVSRSWRRDKDKAAATLAADLADAWALVTHMSAAATEAVLAGVPVFVTGPCAATPVASGRLERIETPAYPEWRELWACGLAGMQWTIEEIRAGAAWRALNAQVLTSAR